jgi:glucokinase
MKACVDIGGSKIAISLADAMGWRWRASIPTPRSGPRETLANAVVAQIQDGAAALNVDHSLINAIGVSSCGPFRRLENAIELAAPNICRAHAGEHAGAANDWRTVPLESVLREHFGLVLIENDAVAALRAESRWGALKGVDSGAFVTWSTGIGFGLMVDGHILRGTHGNAGHAGHGFVTENESAPCGCGNTGDLESLVSGSALERRFGQPAQALFARAQQGDDALAAALNVATARFATALYNVAVTLDLSVIAIGGSVFLGQQDWLLPRIRAHIASKSALIAEGLSIVPAGLGREVGDFGALSLIAPDDWTWMRAPSQGAAHLTTPIPRPPLSAA